MPRTISGTMTRNKDTVNLTEIFVKWIHSGWVN